MRSEVMEYYVEYRKKKLIEGHAIFKATIKIKLVLLENAVVYSSCIYKTLNSLTRIF